MCLAICGHGVSRAGKAGTAVYLGMGQEVQERKVGELKKGEGLGRKEILLSAKPVRHGTNAGGGS